MSSQKCTRNVKNMLYLGAQYNSCYRVINNGKMEIRKQLNILQTTDERVRDR